jgi:Rps23 Pro-64 3,4-dihydroxylase Tpa1-like proline 4-hydroxylase
MLLPHARRELGVPWFRLGSVEQQLHVHGAGDFFDRHVDNGSHDTVARRVSAVYYFHESPPRFEGGALCLYDELDCDGQRQIGPSGTTLEPLDNSLVIFPSRVSHEVEPVRLRDGDFGASRFTVTLWCRDAAGPEHPDDAPLRD